jgi:cobalt-zinc-cadmium efflux system outer membrane protein
MNRDFGMAGIVSLWVTKVSPMFRQACLVVAVIVRATACRAEAPFLTISEAVDEAQKHNPEIRALSAAVVSAHGELATAVTWSNPDLTTETGVRNIRSGSGSSASEFHGLYQLSQTIEFPGKRRLRRAVAEKNIEVQELARTGFRNQLTIQVRHAYYTILVSEEILALKEQRLTLAKAFVESARKKVTGGVAQEFDATKAEVEAIAAQKELRDTQAQGVAARAALNTLLGREPRAELKVAGPLDMDVTLPDETNLLREVSMRNPSLLVQAAEAERASLNVQSVRRSRLPDFSVGPVVEYIKDEQTYDLGISLPLPLWDQKKGEIASAAAEQDKAEAELEVSRHEIIRAVTSAYHNLAAAKESLTLFTPDLLARLKTALDGAAQSYVEGRVSLLFYLETQRTYFDTQADYFDTLQKLYDAQAELQAAVGMPLSELEKSTGKQENTK